MKRLFLLALLFVAAPVLAQTCVLHMAMTYTEGDQKHTLTSGYEGLTAAEAKDVVARSDVVLKAAAKEQDKGGKGVVTLGGDTTCTGVTLLATEHRGVTLQGAQKIWRTGLTAGLDILKQNEDRAAKGHKRAFGND